MSNMEMPGHNQVTHELRDKQSGSKALIGAIHRNKVAYAIFTSKNQTEAAKKLGVTPNTVSKWLKDPVLQKDLEDINNAVRVASETKLAGLLDRTIERMSEFMEKEDDPDTFIKYAKEVFKLGITDQKKGRAQKDRPPEVQFVINLPNIGSSTDDDKKVVDAEFEIKDPDDAS